MSTQNVMTLMYLWCGSRTDVFFSPSNPSGINLIDSTMFPLMLIDSRLRWNCIKKESNDKNKVMGWRHRHVEAGKDQGYVKPHLEFAACFPLPTALPDTRHTPTLLSGVSSKFCQNVCLTYTLMLKKCRFRLQWFCYLSFRWPSDIISDLLLKQSLVIFS